MKLNTNIIITKIFSFEMAHALLNYDGACKNIHGHSYELHVSVLGKPLQQEGHPKNGMVIDFKVLKTLVKEEIIQHYDHALVLNEQSAPELIASLKKINQKIILTPFQPTSENLLLSFVQKIHDKLPKGVELSRLKLYETASSYAEWERQPRN